LACFNKLTTKAFIDNSVVAYVFWPSFIKKKGNRTVDVFGCQLYAVVL